MMRRILAGVAAAVAAMIALAGPALAHGDHEAWALARQLPAGPYSISLWQVYPDNGTAMTPHLTVMFDGLGSTPAAVRLLVTVNGASFPVVPSKTTPNGLETTQGLAPGDIVVVKVIEATRTWELGPVVATPPPTSMLPMEQFLYVSIFLTIATAWWVVRRTARAWRRPVAVIAGRLPAS